MKGSAGGREKKKNFHRCVVRAAVRKGDAVMMMGIGGGWLYEKERGRKESRDDLIKRDENE